MTSTRALESGPNGPAGTRDDRLHRGRNVVLAFLVRALLRFLDSGRSALTSYHFSPYSTGILVTLQMQGWGQVANQTTLMILLVIFNQNDDRTAPPYSLKTVQLTYRVSFGLITILHAWLAYHRFYHIKDADTEVQKAKKRQNTSGYDVQSLKLIGGHYWHRLVATAGGWFFNDL